MYMHQDSLNGPCACTTLRKAARAVGRVYDEALAGRGMTTAQFAVLRHVSRGDGVPLSRLAEALVMDRSSLYRAVSPLETKGWIETEAGPGKSRLARLSDAGRAALAEAEPDWEAAQERIIGAMGPDIWGGLEFMLKTVTRLAQKA
jgi:DNA-binding MarR family transcriptional regulator